MLSCFCEGGIFTVKWGGGIFTEIIFTVNMPPAKILPSQLAKLCYSFTFEMITFLWHPLTPKCTWPSQNKPKKTLIKFRDNCFRNYAPFTSRGGGIITKMTVQLNRAMQKILPNALHCYEVNCGPEKEWSPGRRWQGVLAGKWGNSQQILYNCLKEDFWPFPTRDQLAGDWLGDCFFRCISEESTNSHSVTPNC